MTGTLNQGDCCATKALNSAASGRPRKIWVRRISAAADVPEETGQLISFPVCAKIYMSVCCRGERENMLLLFHCGIAASTQPIFCLVSST